jgi:putative intracellular protease/amidase
MTDPVPSKSLGFVFIDRFADWEYGLLAASAVEWFGAAAVALTPNGGPVRSAAGFSLAGERPLTADAAEGLDAVIVVGSEGWSSALPIDIRELLQCVASRGGVVGGICAGTLALARAGLFAGRDHTSNGREWIRQQLGFYPGDSRYVDVLEAVRDGPVVSAPGSAPGTFAIAVLRALYPGRAEAIDRMWPVFAREYLEGSAGAPQARSRVA